LRAFRLCLRRHLLRWLQRQFDAAARRLQPASTASRVLRRFGATCLRTTREEINSGQQMNPQAAPEESQGTPVQALRWRGFGNAKKSARRASCTPSKS